MSPFILFALCVLLPEVMSLDKEKIKNAIEELEKSARNDKDEKREIELEIKGLSETYKSLLSNLTEVKIDISNESRQTVKTLTDTIYKLGAFKAVNTREREEINKHKLFLRKLSFAQKLLSQEINLYEQRKNDGDETECQELVAQKYHKLSSRFLESDDEVLVLTEELKLAELAAYEAALERDDLKRKLEEEKKLWNQEVKSVAEVIKTYLTNLAELQSKLDVKNEELQEEEKTLVNLLKEKAVLRDSIRKADVKYKNDFGVVMSFREAAECYRDIKAVFRTIKVIEYHNKPALKESTI